LKPAKLTIPLISLIHLQVAKKFRVY